MILEVKHGGCISNVMHAVTFAGAVEADLEDLKPER